MVPERSRPLIKLFRMSPIQPRYNGCCAFHLQKGGEKLGYESEAFAIYDTMKYIKPSVRTLCVGTAFGESAMLLAAGEKVRCAVHASRCITSSMFC